MKRSLPCLALGFLLCAASVHAQLYKWVGTDGKVNYTDTPPPPSATKVEKRSVAAGSSESELPYELSEAAKGNPVTLFTTANCVPCDDGRKLLNKRGVPFTEKTVSSNDDIAQMREAGGDTQLPFLTIGRNKQRGFEADTWNNALTAAGYPESSRLPKDYHNPQAEPATPAAKQAANQPGIPVKPNGGGNKMVTKPSSDSQPPATGNAPPGFRF